MNLPIALDFFFHICILMHLRKPELAKLSGLNAFHFLRLPTLEHVLLPDNKSFALRNSDVYRSQGKHTISEVLGNEG